MTWNKNSVFYTFDRAVPFKNLSVYPIEMSDFVYFNYFAECLVIDKNSIPDAKVISMTYLEYLYYLHFVEKQEDYLDRLYALLRMVFGKNEAKENEFVIQFGSFDENKKPYFTIEEKIDTGKKDNENNIIYEIRKTKVDNEEFNNLKQIICEQNLVDIPNENIIKSVRDEIKRQKAFRQKMSGWKPGDLEDQILCVTAATGMLPDDIYKLTIRKFTKLVLRIDELLHYKIYMTAKMGGFVKFEDKNFPLHWMRDLEKSSEFEGLAFESESIENKISGDGKVNIGKNKKALNKKRNANN